MCRRSFALRYVLPILVLQGVLIGSLAIGRDTLYLRDVLNTHLSGVASMAQTTEVGVPPTLNLSRAGGQPASGNPNYLPFYPTSLIHSVTSSLWALNAHFWLHFLCLPWAFFALARVWGLARESAWAAAVFYTFSGFALSQMSYYNLIPVVTWSPLLVAVWLRLGRQPTPRRLALATGLWCVVLLSGDPTMILLAALATAGAVVIDGKGGRWSGRRIGAFLVAASAGSLLALPQWIEFWRILPTSFRAVQGFGATVVVGRFQWSHLIEWLVPTFFGRVDQLGSSAFWGHEYFGGALPLFITLAPGYLVIMLWLIGPQRSRAGTWAALCAAVGIGLSSGLASRVVELVSLGGGGSLLRFPVKGWLLVTLGGALLAGSAFEGLLFEPSSRRRRRLMLVWGLMLASMTFLLWFSYRGMNGAGTNWLRGLAREVMEAEAARWFELAAAGLAVLLVLGLEIVALSRRPRIAGPLLVLTFAISQVGFLGFTVARDGVENYREGRVVEWPEEGSRVVHAGVSRLPEWGLSQQWGGQGSAAQLARRAARQAYPFAAVDARLRYELNPSPEGLDSYLTYLALDATRRASLEDRVALFRTWGVDALVSRPGLSVEGLVESWRPDASLDVAGYRVTDPLPEVRLVRGARYAPSPRDVLGEMLSGDFDPMSEVVILGSGVNTAGRGESLVVERATHREIIVQTSSDFPTFLVVQRTYQPVYRAAVDGAEASIEVADLHRLAIPVPAGRRRVRLWIDTTSRKWAFGGSLFGLCLLIAAGRILSRGATVGPSAMV